MIRRSIRSVGAVLLALVVVAIASTAAFAATGTWNGALDSSHSTRLSFRYTGSNVTNFTIAIIGCTSVNGYQTETLHIPSAPVRGGKISVTYHPSKAPKGVEVKLRGVISGNHLVGTVEGTGLCGTGKQSFHANPGPYKPVAAAKPRAGSCTAAGCLASDGMYIKVSGLDTTITSIADSNNIYDSSPDAFLVPGGVGLSVTGTNRSASDPTTLTPAANFQLRLGSGGLVQADPTLSTVVTGSGAPFVCADGSVSQALTRSASFGPTKLCFDAAKSSDRLHLTLYYMPDGSDVLAKILLS